MSRRSRLLMPRRTLLLVVALAASCLIALATLWINGTVHSASDAGTLPDMRGNRVQLDPGEALSPAVLAQMNVTDSTGSRFIVPSVGLDVPLGAMNEVDQQITPPGFTSANWVRNIGTSPASPQAGTVYVVAHSIRGGGAAPGNYLEDIHTQQSRLRPGAIIQVASVRYRVVSSALKAKTALPSDSNIWSDIPNRLIVITCMEFPSAAPSIDNLVITAVRDN